MTTPTKKSGLRLAPLPRKEEPTPIITTTDPNPDAEWLPGEDCYSVGFDGFREIDFSQESAFGYKHTPVPDSSPLRNLTPPQHLGEFDQVTSSRPHENVSRGTSTTNPAKIPSAYTSTKQKLLAQLLVQQYTVRMLTTLLSEASQVEYEESPLPANYNHLIRHTPQSIAQ